MKISMLAFTMTGMMTVASSCKSTGSSTVAGDESTQSAPTSDGATDYSEHYALIPLEDTPGATHRLKVGDCKVYRWAETWIIVGKANQPLVTIKLPKDINAGLMVAGQEATRNGEHLQSQADISRDDNGTATLTYDVYNYDPTALGGVFSRNQATIVIDSSGDLQSVVAKETDSTRFALLGPYLPFKVKTSFNCP